MSYISFFYVTDLTEQQILFSEFSEILLHPGELMGLAVTEFFFFFFFFKSEVVQKKHTHIGHFFLAF